jgi:predicted DNA-binding transcriptional regulator YafY
MRTFKVERIESARVLDKETYTVPKGFDANEYLGSALGISVYGPAETVKLRFGTEIARVAQETVWHPSQKTKAEPDGTAMVTLNVPITTELVNFVMGWGPAVEVLEPVSLRRRVAGAAKAMSKMYGKLRPARKG